MSSVNYRKLVKEDSFIGQYMKYMSAVETSTSYDFWCAIWLIGTCCGRSVVVDRPRAPVYLNWYLILAAESGITRKSTAVRETSKLCQGTGQPEQRPLVVSTKQSPEQFEYAFGEQSRATGATYAALIYPELTSILGKESYMHHMPAYLTDIYDGESRRGKLDRPDINNPFVSFLSASTPSWLVTAINPQVIEGGFASRVIFVCDDKRKRSIPWPHDTEERIRDDAKRLLDECVQSARAVGHIQINPTGLAKFSRWYNTRVVNTDAFRASFDAREDDHVLRLAACLAINDTSFELQSGHISAAIKVIADVKERAYALFGGSYDIKSKISAGVDRVKEVLLQFGMDGIKHSELHRRTQHHMNGADLKLLMKIMHELQMVQMFEIAGTRGRVYRATKGIEQLNMHASIMERLGKKDG